MKKPVPIAAVLVVVSCSFSILGMTAGPGAAQERATPGTATVQSGGGPLGADVFRIKEVDLGDQSWGQNLLRVSVENLSGEPQPFWLHVGGRYQNTGRPRGFGMGMEEVVVLEAHEERIVEHPYWIPPQVGELSYGVKFVLPTGSTPPWEQEPFLRETYTVTYETPNRRCNELTPLPQSLKYDWLEEYRDGARIRPFEVVSTEHFVFYVLPDSPAAKEIEAIRGRRERVMEEVCAFLEVSVDARINFFLFPDAASKRWCMGHQGDGLAFDATIAEIYSEDTRLDPAHELTHIAASLVGSPPALLNEGLAAYMQAGHEWNGEHVDRTAAELLSEGRLVSLAELLTRTEIGSRPDDGKVAYPQSASFVKFVIDTYGREQFLKLYGALRNGAEDNAARFEEVLGVELGTAEQEWREALEAV